MKKKYKAILVSHTHWDREWYLPFREFRKKLVVLIDKLLDILEKDHDFKSFTLDGQTVVLEDYLEKRPQNIERLKRFIREKRIFIGPWFVLCDEFLVSGEAIIRNLMSGHKIAEEFGHVMKIGYIPDSFGHIAQMPQILQGFGIDSAIFTRGLGNEWDGLKTEFNWEASDGSRVLAVFQKNGYGSLGSLGCEKVGDEKSGNPALKEEALTRIVREINDIAPHASSTILLFNNGCDHLEAQPEIPEFIEYLNGKIENTEIIQGSLEDFINLVTIENKYSGNIRGELHNGKYHPILSGVFSTRMYLKIQNHEIETLLANYAEPFSAIHFITGGEYDAASLSDAWKTCLLNHPHDSICGCSIDLVHDQDMQKRFDTARKTGEKLRDQSIRAVSRKISTESGFVSSVPVIVFNPLGFERSDFARIPVQKFSENFQKSPFGFIVTDSAGNEVQSQTIPSIPEKKGNIELAFHADCIPSFGYKTFYLTKSMSKMKSGESSVSKQEPTIENEFFMVAVNGNGSLVILDKRTGQLLKNCNIFEDTEDAGDEYDFSPAFNSETFTTENEKPEISLICNGNAAGILKIRYDFNLPESLSEDRKKRSVRRVSCPLTAYASLFKGVPRIDICTVFENNAKDHRLRALFPASFKTDYAVAETQFGVLIRHINQQDSEGWIQKPATTKPQKTFLCIENNCLGICLINHGLPEYEVRQKSLHTEICLTLIRAAGWLSREDLLTRPYHAGPQIETPGAQCTGSHTFLYSIVPYDGNFADSMIWQQSHAFNVPLFPVISDQHKGELPHECSFLRIEPENLVLSAFKKADARDSIIVRIYNTTEKDTQGCLKFFRPISHVFSTDLNENRKGELSIYSGNEVHFPISGFRIMTFEVEYALRA